MANIHDYYRKNFLYEGQKLILPELRDKLAYTCASCKFFVLVTGREETRNGCAAQIPRYASLTRRIPGEIDVAAVLRWVGRKGLEKMLSAADPCRLACERFHPNPRGGSRA